MFQPDAVRPTRDLTLSEQGQPKDSDLGDIRGSSYPHKRQIAFCMYSLGFGVQLVPVILPLLQKWSPTKKLRIKMAWFL